MAMSETAQTQEATPPSTTPPPDAPPAMPLLYVSGDGKLFLTPEVVEFIRRTNQIPGNLILVTPNDCAANAQTPGEIANQQTALTNIFQQHGVSNPATQAAAMCRETGAGAQPMPNVDGTSSRIVVLPGNETTVEEYFRTRTGLPPGVAVALPGNIHDWRAFTAFHELGHVQANHVGSRLDATSVEIQADSMAIQRYQQAHAAGVVSDPNVANAYVAGRVLSAILKPYEHRTVNSHDLTALQGTAVAANLQGHETEYFLQMHNARDQLFANVLQQTNPIQYQLLRAEIIENYTFNGAGNATPAQVQEFEEARRFAQNNKTPEAAARLSAAVDHITIPDNKERQRMQDRLQHGVRDTVQNNMSTYAPHLVGAAQAGLAQHQFDNNPAGAALMTQFVAAATTYAPGYFGINKPGSGSNSSTGGVKPATGNTAASVSTGDSGAASGANGVKPKAAKSTVGGALRKFVTRQFKGDQKTTAADGPNPGIDDATRARAFAWVKKQNPTTTPATVTSSAGSAGVQSGTPAIDVGSPASSSAVAGKPNERVSTPRKPLELTAAQQKLSSIRAEETQRVGANQQMYPNATVVPDEYGRVSREPGARTAYEPWSSRPQQTQSRQNSGFVVGLSGSVAAGDTGAGASFRRVAEAKATERAEHAAAAEKAAQASAPAKPMPFTGHAVRG
jgi:hypothetical protein